MIISFQTKKKPENDNFFNRNKFVIIILLGVGVVAVIGYKYGYFNFFYGDSNDETSLIKSELEKKII